jgi:hypothetical protein
VFGTGVEIPYVFEKQTFCKVVVIDDDSDGLGVDVDHLGEAEFTLGQVSSGTLCRLNLLSWINKTSYEIDQSLPTADWLIFITC